MASIHSLVKCSTLLISLFPCTGFTSPTLSPKSPKSPAIDRPACQSPSRNPLDGCPHGTLLVGPSAHYTTIQSAAASLPNDTSAATILIFPGNYTEQINVTRAGPTYLLGQTRNIKDQSANTVNVIWAAVAGTGDNAYTSTLTVAPNLNAALTESGPTGFVVPPNTPFGTTDFRAYNLNFINDFAPYSDGPSFALSMGYSNTGFYYCGFFSYQDTIYVGKLGSAYFYKNTIAGQTDFFYGFGTAGIKSANVRLRECGGGITAWKARASSFPESMSSDPSPSNAQHRSIFSHTYLDDSIIPAGYIIWSASDPRVHNYTFMAEYKDYGPGFNLTARLAAANITKELTPQQFEPYSSPQKVFQYPDGSFGNYEWIDFGT